MIRIKLDVDIEVERERISPMISQVLSDVLDGTVTNRKLFTSEIKKIESIFFYLDECYV